MPANGSWGGENAAPPYVDAALLASDNNFAPLLLPQLITGCNYIDWLKSCGRYLEIYV